ncbi:MAG: shikimate kinase [Acidobacteriaceae bacterium]
MTSTLQDLEEEITIASIPSEAAETLLDSSNAPQTLPAQPLQLFHPMRSTPPTYAKPGTGAVRRVVLTGYMGAGKTTVGRLLAARIGWEFVDLDDLIEQRTGKTIADIILHDSEPAFRRIESQALVVALGRRDAVLALGGGATESLTNRLLLEQTPATLNVFLDAPFDVLLQRCKTQSNAAVRPILFDPAAAESRFQTRLPLYRRIAGLTLETSAQDADATVDALLAALAPS